MSTAVDEFSTVVRDRLAPALRELGLKGSGTAFLLPDEQSWAIVGFQKSRTSDRREVRFTVNLTVANKLDWERARVVTPWLPARPSGNGRYPVGTVVRLGLIMPGGRDRWWSVTASAPAAEIVADVIAAIRDHGIPWLRARVA